MMARDQKERINGAVHDCVQRCHGSDAILARIEQYLEELRHRPDWFEYEVQIVNSRVRKLIRAMVLSESVRAFNDQPAR
jgi:hypothetical protein